MKTSKKIGLALGGGGARGIAHIGVIRGMKKAGITPDYLAGSSMGAIIAALLAIDKDWSLIEEEALSFDSGKAIKKLYDFGKVGQAVLNGIKVKKFLHDQFGDLEFKDTIIPLQIVACDLESGDEIVIKEGRIVDAIFASISVPGIFPPVKIGNKYLIDGGVVNPTPFDLVHKMGADIVIGVDLIDNKPPAITKTPGFATTLLLSFEIIRRQAVAHKLQFINDNTIIIKPELRDFMASFKFYDIEKFIDSGEDAFNKSLPKINQLLTIDK